MIYLLFMSRVLTMTLTESTNICCIGDRIACTVKLNIKETFLRNNGFPANVYIVNGLYGLYAVRDWKTYHLTNLLFSESRKDFCYSVPTLGNPWTYVKRGWYYKVWQPIMNPPELLLKIIEVNFEFFFFFF